MPGKVTTRVTFLVCAGLSALFVLLGLTVLQARGPLPVDREVLDAVLRHRGPTSAARVVTQFGGPAVDGVVLAVSVLAAVRLRDRRLLLALPVLIAGQVLRTLLSVTVHRPRPPVAARLSEASGLAWPSGHTTSATLGWGLAAFLVATACTARSPGLLAVAVGTTFGVVVGATRLLLRVHWLTDALAGILLGDLMLILGIWILTGRDPLAPRDP